MVAIKTATEVLPAVLALALAVSNSVAGSGAIGAADPNDSSWIEGRTALGTKDWASAAEHFNAYRARHVSDPAGWILEAWTRRESGQQEAADELFAGVLRLDPSQPDALMHFAEKAWHEGDRAEVMRRLEAIGAPPAHLQDSFHHLFGVTLIMQGGDSRKAIQHLTQSHRTDKPTRLLLALAYMRSGQESGALPVLGEICPPSPAETSIRAWMRCSDVDYCGELLDQHLEIMSRLLAGSPKGGTDEEVADAVRIFIRHGRRPPDPVQHLQEVAERRPKECRLKLLLALAQDLPVGSAVPASCNLLRDARSCSEEGGDSSWPAFSGPLLDPATGALLDLSSFSSVVGRIISVRCTTIGGE